MRINTESRFVPLLGSVALGYAINFVLAVIVFLVFGIPMLLNDGTFKGTRDIDELLRYSSFLSIYGMGLGLLTEIVFKDKPLREKLSICFIAILFSPFIVFFPLVSFLDFIDNGDIKTFSEVFFLSLPLWGVLATSLYMRFKSFKNVDAFTYSFSYIIVFVGLFWAGLFSEILNIEGVGVIIIVIAFNVLFALIGVALCKSFFRWVYNEKR